MPPHAKLSIKHDMGELFLNTQLKKFLFLVMATILNGGRVVRHNYKRRPSKPNFA